MVASDGVSLRHATSNNDYNGWFAFLSRLKKEKLDEEDVLREFEQVAMPYIKHERPMFERVSPPTGNWADFHLGSLVGFAVEFPLERPDEIWIPDESLVSVFKIAARGLQRASDLLADVGTSLLAYSYSAC